MHVHGIKVRKEKQTNKQRNSDLKDIKRNKTEAYYMKETEAKNSD